MTSSSKSKPATIIAERLNEVRRGIRTYIGLDTLLSTVVWGLAFFWLVIAADYLPIRLGSTEMPKAIRAVALTILVVGIAYIVIRVGLRRLFVRISDSTAAIIWERKFRELGGKLVTAVQLAGKDAPEDANPELFQAMVDKVTTEAAEGVGPLKSASIFDWRPLSLRGLIAGLLLFGTTYSAVTNQVWFSLALNRFFALSDQDWPRQTRLYPDSLQLVLPSFSGETATRKQTLTFSDEKLNVPRGSSGVLRIIADTTAPEVPEICTLTYLTQDGQRGQTALKSVNGGPENGQLFLLDGPPLESIVESMTLDIFGGDFRLRDYRIDVIDPAVIEGMKVDCKYPAYLFEEQTGRWGPEILNYQFGMQVPEGTEVALVGTSSDALSAVEYLIRTGSTPDSETPSITRLPISGKEFRIPLPVWKGNIVIECLTYDSAGLPGAQVQRYQLSAVADQLPVVNTRLVGIGSEITAKAYLPIQGKITDDHQISKSWLEFGDVETGKFQEPVNVDAAGEVNQVLDLQQLSDNGKIQLPLNSTVGLQVTAQDRYDLEAGQHLGLGEPIQLTVVTPEQLILSLEKRELALRGRLEQIIRELTDLQTLLGKVQISPWNQTEVVGVDPNGELEEDEPPSATEAAKPEQKNDSEAEIAETKRKELAAARRRQTLFIQQASVQTDKSFDEVNGILTEITQIRDELIHNRVDSTDRRERLENRIQAPLNSVITGSFPKLKSAIRDLIQLTPDSSAGPDKTSETIQFTAIVINELDNVLQNMLDIESYNEIVDMVRAMLEQQEKILERTKTEQKQRVLDLFEP